jgi:hypothetical protein
MTAARQWAFEEFGDAELGDQRRRHRLVSIAAAAAASPAGTVTAVVSGSAEREGAFRLLESDRVSASAVARASFEAGVRRAHPHKFVYVPIDGSSLSLVDRVGGREVGCVGTWTSAGRGLLVASALVVSPDGSPLGLCGQRYWSRATRVASRRKPHLSMRSEMRHSVELVDEVLARFAEHAPDVEPWLQLDRGYDAWPILQRAKTTRMTVRASHNRTVRADRRAPIKYLFDEARAAPLLGTYDVEVPERPGRPARIARMRVRARLVSLELKVTRSRREYVPMYVVHAEERRSHDPLRWVLLTSVPVHSLDDALAVIDGYATRWRIEEFHRAWKRGVCNVEDTQLRGRNAIIKWATILAAVAVRATRLTYLAREKPLAPADEEFTRWELDAAIALRRPKGVKPGANPTLELAVRWIADIGGYTGKSSGGPPGSTVIARGLAKVAILAEGLRNLAEMR